MGERVDHVAISVRDLSVSRKWLAAVVGMETFRGDDPNFADDDLAMVRRGQAFVALLKLPQGESPLRGSRSQKGHFALRVANEEFADFRLRLPKLLETHRVSEEQSVEVQFEDYGVQRSLFFHDPDGNELEVTTWDEVERGEDTPAADFLRKALLLDVRSVAEYQQVALPKSILVPHTNFLENGSGAVQQVLHEVNGD